MNIFVLLYFNSCYLHYPTGPSCTSGFLSLPDLRRRTLDVNINRVIRKGQQLSLFPDINFTCNGSITKWIVGAKLRRSGDDRPELQIWRRDIGGWNSYNKINFSLLTPNETSDSNVHEYYPVTPLEFLEGDILGVYTPNSNNTRLVVYYQENTGPENYRRTNIIPPAPSTFTLRSVFKHDYPLVTVEISTGIHCNNVYICSALPLTDTSIISIHVSK